MTDWERCRPWIEAVLAKTGTHTFADVIALVGRGDATFWPGRRAVIVTEFHNYPLKRLLNFWIVGGNLREIKRMRPAIEAWGRRQGASGAVGYGRKGWGRVFPDYEAQQIMFLKDFG